MRSSLVTLVLLLHAVPAAAQLGPNGPPAEVVENKLPRDLEGIGIDERVGATIPADLHFLDHTGRDVRLGDYFKDGKPVMLVLAYYECPMLCTVVLNGVLDGLRELPFDVGAGFRVVTVSFDPRDDVNAAARKRDTYVNAYGKPIPDKGWDFLVMRPGDPASVKALADAVGFHYQWHADSKQFAHAAGAFVFTPSGQLARTLNGIRFPAMNLRLTLVEASEGKLGGPWDKVLLFCYHYDPNAKGYTLVAARIMRFGGLLMVVVLAVVLGRFWRRERRRARNEARAA
jgi:protein SCO1/2